MLVIDSNENLIIVTYKSDFSVRCTRILNSHSKLIITRF